MLDGDVARRCISNESEVIEILNSNNVIIEFDFISDTYLNLKLNS